MIWLCLLGLAAAIAGAGVAIARGTVEVVSEMTSGTPPWRQDSDE